MRRPRLSVYFPLILAIVLITGIFIGLQFRQNELARWNPFSSHYDPYRKIREILKYAEENYVDEIQPDTLTERTVFTLLQSLDPHSIYITAREFNEANDPLQGKFEGIGVQFRVEKDTVVVINTISGGPAEKVGIRGGDRIVKVDRDMIAGVKITNDDVMRKLKGPKGTTVDVSIYRRGIRELLDFTITRDIIPTFSLDVRYMINRETGYIKLGNFAAKTHEEFVKAMEELKEQGMNRLILDLRGNGGGYLQDAIQIADEFLEEDKIIVYTEGKNRPKKISFATGDGLFEKEKLVILIDEWSASASEIVAGAVQDNDRGTIIGRRSFGKGLVQEQLEFPDRSAVRLTVARYHTPTGRCIQKPYNNGIDQYYSELLGRFTNGELETPDSIHFLDSLKYTTPGGKTVYGGGGIMPDVFIPVEKNPELNLYREVLDKNLIYPYAFDYTDKYRKQLGKFRSAEEFNKGFFIDGSILADFMKYAREKGASIPSAGNQASEKRIRALLKAFIGRNIYDNPAFYPTLNEADPAVIKAIEILENK
ncbi:MAG: S41 family peptidase [Bacteroidetes bacterium]|nr:S41 family peptidase [Bacteroidota bacterium]